MSNQLISSVAPSDIFITKTSQLAAVNTQINIQVARQFILSTNAGTVQIRPTVGQLWPRSSK